MRYIPKSNRVPKEFLANTLGVPNYDSLYGNQKQVIKSLLINEQCGLCAYCNQSITASTCTVEHIICQAHNSSLSLSYHNLVAVCKGNQGVDAEQSHCDVYRSNRSKNDYFIPFLYFNKCLTTAWDSLNPFFDVEYSHRTQVYSGKVVPRETNLQGYPNNVKRVQEAIEILNLNADVLVSSRREKWEMVRETQLLNNMSWQSIFSYYLNLSPPTDFLEYVLLAIRKQVH